MMGGVKRGMWWLLTAQDIKQHNKNSPSKVYMYT